MSDGLALEVRDLVVQGPEAPILTLDALDVPEGRSLGVRGASGAGKTTLIFALAGLQPAAGRIAWGGIDLVAMGPSERRLFRAANIGLVFQDFLLFEELGTFANASVASLFLPRRRRSGNRKRAQALIERLGVPERSSVATLSGGERQRVAVARALASDPRVVLADEPTAALHREAAEIVTADLIAQTREAGRTLVVASHDDGLLSRLDEVIELSGGMRRAA